MRRKPLAVELTNARHQENMKRNRAALNRILKDLKAGKSASLEDQRQMAMLAAWALFQARPAIHRAIEELLGRVPKVILDAGRHFSYYWVEKLK